ncbi:STM3941 family protein [Duncaniella freteri]|uniref:STM3941 family protein n=1 Tax=Duncaniella freteri TaxID=2530391 RepID=UPI00336C0582
MYWRKVFCYTYSKFVPRIIHAIKRNEVMKPTDKTNHTISFADVRTFRFISGCSPKMIAFDYNTIPLIHKYEDSSRFKQSLMNFNFNHTGAIENIPVVNLTNERERYMHLIEQTFEM